MRSVVAPARWTIAGDARRLCLTGELYTRDAAAIWSALHARTAALGDGALEVDLAQAADVDGTVMALLVELRSELARRGVTVAITHAGARIGQLVHLYGGDRAARPEPRQARRSTITAIGEVLASTATHARRSIEFAGELVQGLAALIRRPALGGWRELGPLIARTGTDGLAIVVVLDFLVGFVMAYQSTRLLQTYGANIYVADIVGISMTRELAPLITAIIITGRSGAGFAAEIGTMRVSEEIDALRTLGIAPVPYLVVPRIVALAIVAPVLALAGDIAGVVGGLAVGTLSLDVHPHAYIAELRDVLVSSDVWTGLVKSVLFGIAIAIVGCQQGLTTRGAASGVGRSTTTTVVICLFALVGIDTAMTILFRGVGL